MCYHTYALVLRDLPRGRPDYYACIVGRASLAIYKNMELSCSARIVSAVIITHVHM